MYEMFKCRSYIPLVKEEIDRRELEERKIHSGSQNILVLSVHDQARVNAGKGFNVYEGEGCMAG
jgi:hypothetical protein